MEAIVVTENLEESMKNRVLEMLLKLRRKTEFKFLIPRNPSSSTSISPRYIKQYNDVELSALGMAIPSVVTIAEILKKNGVATQKKILTSTVDMKWETNGRTVQKAKIEIVLGKPEDSDNQAAATAVAAAAAATPAVENADKKE
ncbi:Uncharacterized protein CK203_001020 [Vitis vinifera]|uniref:DNA/RNA-binding protein Alba-like domain-containing protein n=1 Tax=Vitis vinifera TaxID=29760 RepID=A0A438F602_VITVI|nr:Uncharacterized protein CK203_095548 [Vitis vinifera]RVX21674.1 Uncharacterized protein CK203_001020 [Vitis vinifera]